MQHDLFEIEYEYDGGVMVLLDAAGSPHRYEWYRDDSGDIRFPHDITPQELRAVLIEKIESHSVERNLRPFE